jgi:hypothetical protein
MDPIRRAMGVTATGPDVPRLRGDAGSFAVPVPVAAASATAMAALDGLLAVQEAAAEPWREREARRRGHALLAELTALQRDLLADQVSGSRLARLRALAADVQLPANPALRAALEAVVLRARIELVRFGGT